MSFYSIIAIILLGFVLYYFRQKQEHSENFSIFILFFGKTKCEGIN